MITRPGASPTARFKASLMTRLAQRAMTTRTTGLDGFAKRLLESSVSAPPEPDPELEHPDAWDRPID